MEPYHYNFHELKRHHYYSSYWNDAITIHSSLKIRHSIHSEHHWVHTQAYVFSCGPKGPCCCPCLQHNDTRGPHVISFLHLLQLTSTGQRTGCTRAGELYPGVQTGELGPAAATGPPPRCAGKRARPHRGLTGWPELRTAADVVAGGRKLGLARRPHRSTRAPASHPKSPIPERRGHGAVVEPRSSLLLGEGRAAANAWSRPGR